MSAFSVILLLFLISVNKERRVLGQTSSTATTIAATTSSAATNLPTTTTSSAAATVPATSSAATAPATSQTTTTTGSTVTAAITAEKEDSTMTTTTASSSTASTPTKQVEIKTTEEPNDCLHGTWGSGCLNACGRGCPIPGSCDKDTGFCKDYETMGCLQGYENDSSCANPICEYDCNGGDCVAPNLCQNCPLHFASGKSCRNIRLDGFLKGSLSSFAILTAVVALLSVSSKWYVRRKVQKNVS